MLDLEFFWSEVNLLAKNNYGPWNNREDAKNRVVKAEQEVVNAIIERIAESANLEEKTIIDEMMKGMESTNSLPL